MGSVRVKETEKLLQQEKDNDLFSGMNINKYASSIKIDTQVETSSETIVKVSEEKYSPISVRQTKNSSNHFYKNNNIFSISASAPPLYLTRDDNESLNEDDLNTKFLSHDSVFEDREDNIDNDFYKNDGNEMKRYVACGNCHSWLESNIKCDFIVCPICNVVNDCRPSVLTDPEKKFNSDGYFFSIIDQIRECFVGAFTPSSNSSATT